MTTLRDVSARRSRRDPTGKAALFSATPGLPEPVAPESAGADPTAEALQALRHRSRTVVVECSACEHRTRIGYLDFVLLNLPVGLWLPLPGIHFNRRMTCPACGAWTWTRAHWIG